MDEPWRFRSLPPGACPLCAAVHYPFCSPPRPPPPAFAGDGLRLFPPPPFAGSFPHHPPPFWDHRAPPPPPPAAAGPFSGPAIRGPEPWGGGLGFEREPLRPGFHPPPQRFFQDEFLERENSHKRMRFDDCPPRQPPYDRLMPADVERRLNLIRDHGRQQTAGAFEGEQHLNGDFSRDRFVHEGPQDRYFHGQGFGSIGGNGPMFPPEPGFVHQNRPPIADAYEGYRNYPGAPDHQGRKDFEIGGMLNSQFGRYSNAYHEGKDPHRGKRSGDPDAGTFQLPQSDQHGDTVTSSLTYNAYALDGKPFYDSRAQASYPHDYAPQVPPGKYYSSEQQQFHSSDHGLSKQLQYSESGSNQLAPNVFPHDAEGSRPLARIQHSVEDKFEFHSRHAEVIPAPSEIKPSHPEDTEKAFKHHTFPLQEQFGAHNGGNQGGFLHFPSSCSDSMARLHTSQSYSPLQPPPHSVLHVEQSPTRFQVMSSSSKPSLFPVLSNTSATESLPPNGCSFSESHPLPNSGFYNELPLHTSTELPREGLPFAHQAPSKQYLEEGGQTFPIKNSLKAEPTVIDACQLFKQPHRASRPDHIVIILRGLPGSGKSYLAKALRDLEVENGGNAPRIHAMDDYFMIEVEKNVEDAEGSKSSRGKKQITKKVIEYCYEPEMEEVYRSSMLKAFKKTVDEGIFTFIIVDDRNLRVADFAQFWASAKRSGYEVYVLEAPYKDPTGCAARNVHGFTLDDIQKMAEQWEESPPLYLQLDIQPLFRGDDLNEQSIKEVDMDTDDADHDEEEHKLQDTEDFKSPEPKSSDHPLDYGLTKVGERWDSDEEEPKEVKELGRSKWSNDFDGDIENSSGGEGNSSALSGLIQAYSRTGKSVHWGDRVDKKGFSIGAIKKRTTSSLVIGPGSGYNLVSNPLAEEEDTVESTGKSNINDSKWRFSEQLRAESESFKAVFDKRRHRIGGLNDFDDE